MKQYWMPVPMNLDGKGKNKIIRLKAGTSNPKNYPLGNISVLLALDLSWHLVISFVV